MASKKIVLGSGKLYVVEYDASTGIPAKATLETDNNLLGYIQGGASVSYTPTFYTAKDDLGYVAKKMITEEEVKLTSGIMTWNASVLKKLCATASDITDDTSAHTRTMKVGGTGRYDGKKYVIHFVHEDSEEGDVRVTIVGQNENGFEFSFAKDKETVVNAEFVAVPCDTDGTLLIFEETYSV